MLKIDGEDTSINTSGQRLHVVVFADECGHGDTGGRIMRLFAETSTDL